MSSYRDVIKKYFPKVIRRIHPDFFYWDQEKKDLNTASLKVLNSSISDFYNNKQTLRAESNAQRLIFYHTSPKDGKEVASNSPVVHDLGCIDEGLSAYIGCPHIKNYQIGSIDSKSLQKCIFELSYLSLCRKLCISIDSEDEKNLKEYVKKNLSASKNSQDLKEHRTNIPGLNEWINMASTKSSTQGSWNRNETRSAFVNTFRKCQYSSR